MLMPGNPVMAMHSPSGMTPPGSTEHRASSSRDRESKRCTRLRFHRWPLLRSRNHISRRVRGADTSTNLRNGCRGSGSGCVIRFCGNLLVRNSRKEDTVVGGDNKDKPPAVKTDQRQQEKTGPPYNGASEGSSIVREDQSESARLRDSHSYHFRTCLTGIAVATGTLPRNICCDSVHSHRSHTTLFTWSIPRSHAETVSGQISSENGSPWNSRNLGK